MGDSETLKSKLGKGKNLLLSTESANSCLKH